MDTRAREAALTGRFAIECVYRVFQAAFCVSCSWQAGDHGRKGPDFYCVHVQRWARSRAQPYTPARINRHSARTFTNRSVTAVF